MANKNRTECDCEGIYNETTSSCDIVPNGVDPCPETWLETAGGWDWQNISDTALTWGYAFGLIKPPNQTNMETEQFMMELQKQRQQMNMIMIGLGIIMLIVVIIVIQKKKQPK